MSGEVELGSVADWIAAIGTVATAFIAIPAALAFMADRRRAKSALVTVEPWGGTDRAGAKALRAVFQEGDRAVLADITVRVAGRSTARVQARDIMEYDPSSAGYRVKEAAPAPSRTLKLAMGRYVDAQDVLTSYFDLLGAKGDLVTLLITIRRHPDGRVLAQKRQELGSRK
jgi:hypothetical protein